MPSYDITLGGTFGVEYDYLGRITSLPGKYAGGGDLEMTYYTSARQYFVVTR